MKKAAVITFLLLSMLLAGCQEKPPVIQLDDEPFLVEASHNQKFDMAQVYDAVDLLDGSGKPLSGDLLEISGSVDLNKPGNYTLELRLVYKNKVAEESLVVHVVDTTKPQILTVDDELMLVAGSDLQLLLQPAQVNAYDDFDGLINDRLSATFESTTDSVGSFPVTYSVIDHAGNKTELVLTVRVTKSMDEYATYLYSEALAVYQGKYFVTDTGKESQADVLLNLESQMSRFTTKGQTQFYNAVGYNNSTAEVTGIISLSKDGDVIHLLKNLRAPRSDYMDTKLVLISARDDYRLYEAVSTYGTSNHITEEVVHRFAIRLVDGIWLIDEFTLPN
ncbi:MAG: DUF5011 domain-containing protein [Erysipelotrichaceae bacterium]|jgi:hypothetical protein|nr:DUF5011 domain-containing protein [Erysipelotrichaceae bacterium]